MSVDFEKRDRVAILTLNRPESMNALDADTNQALIRLWRQVIDDADIRVIVLTGAGEKAFCAGADLKKLGDHYRMTTPLQRRDINSREPGLGGITRNLHMSKPVIAAVNGHCLAGGLELALACDIRVAAEHATFGVTEVRWGLSPNAGGTQRLPRCIPVGVALEMILTGRPIDAKRAYEVGLVNRVVPLSELMTTTMDMASAICQNAPLAVRVGKEAVWRGLEGSLEAGLRLENLLGEPLRQTWDFEEGLQAFREKRPPRYEGR